MKRRNRVYILIMLAATSFNAFGQLKVPGLDEFRNALKSYSAQYDMTCVYPDSQTYDIKGRLAINDNHYYDSSNLRYVFLNDKWYLIADHLQKEISVAHIEKLNKELKSFGEVSASSYLFSEELMMGYLKVNVKKQNDDTTWYQLTFDESEVFESLELTVLRKNFKMIDYRAKVKYPLGEGDNMNVYIDVHCYNIQSPAPKTIFDDRRLIAQKGKDARLKKFKTYKTYR